MGRKKVVGAGGTGPDRSKGGSGFIRRGRGDGRDGGRRGGVAGN